MPKLASIAVALMTTAAITGGTVSLAQAAEPDYDDIVTTVTNETQNEMTLQSADHTKVAPFIEAYDSSRPTPGHQVRTGGSYKYANRIQYQSPLLSPDQLISSTKWKFGNGTELTVDTSGSGAGCWPSEPSEDKFNCKVNRQWAGNVLSVLVIVKEK